MLIERLRYHSRSRLKKVRDLNVREAGEAQLGDLFSLRGTAKLAQE
jgi:hypothetical protein